MKANQTRAILFDMDNTLLQSKIDFMKMRKVVFQLLAQHGIVSTDFEWVTKTPSQIIEAGRSHPRFSSISDILWKQIEEVESEGMENVCIEPYADKLLAELVQRNIDLFILTNNAFPAAKKALQNVNIFPLFRELICREQMDELKPSPAGMWYFFRKYPMYSKTECLFIGDSWIDGMAATKAGVPFLSYKGDVNSLLEKGVCCIGKIDRLDELIRWL